MKVGKLPDHYPQGWPEGPWGVTTFRNRWYVVNRFTLLGKSLGPVAAPARGHTPVNYFDRAMDEAVRRNKAHKVLCWNNAAVGTQLQLF